MLTTTMRVTNEGEDAFEFTTALHTYFRVGDCERARVEGLKSTSYLDSLDGRREKTDEMNAVEFHEEVDRIYLDAPAVLKIRDASMPESGYGGTFTIEKSATLPDAVVWNPWVEKSKKMGDFRDDEYREMVCVEVAGTRKMSVARAQRGKARKQFRSRRELVVISSTSVSIVIYALSIRTSTKKVYRLLHHVQAQIPRCGRRWEIVGDVWVRRTKLLVEIVEEWLVVHLDKLVSQDGAHLIHVSRVCPERVVHAREREPGVDARDSRLHHVRTVYAVNVIGRKRAALLHLHHGFSVAIRFE